MNSSETYVEKELAIELLETADEVRLNWRGRSAQREPGVFLLPLLAQALTRSANGTKKLVMDFTGLEYMNSSTFTPIVKILDEAARCQARVTLEYNQSRKWQTLSFTALKAFETSDGRIALRGR